MKLKYNLKEMFKTIFDPKKGEVFVFFNDKPMTAEKVTPDHKARVEMTKEWHAQAEALAPEIGFEVQPIIFYEVTAKDPAGWLGLAQQARSRSKLERKLEALGPQHIVVAISKESLTPELMRRLKTQNFRCGSAPNVRANSPGFRADYSKIPLRAEALNSRLNAADGVEVFFSGLPRETYKGDLKFYFDLRGEHFHVLENGECRTPGRFVNLPSGCANIVPYPGSLSDPRGKTRTYGTLPVLFDDGLVIFRVKEGRIIEIFGNGAAVDRMKKIVQDPASTDKLVITKLGLGLNEDCRVNGIRVVDEKTMGMHWGYGKGRDFPCVYWRESQITPTVEFVYADGRRERIMTNGIYNHEVLGRK
jgi:leucyl aminopeptidase (aminopeptidase T)